MAPQPPQPVMDTSFLTSMMKTHVKLMQKQLEDGFSLIANKMNTLEEKLAENDSKIANVNRLEDAISIGFCFEALYKCHLFIMAIEENRRD